ncbi:sigma-54-dependent transcriptional regulator [Aestuariispira insulae]|uniref:Two-component system nitrogen regulation response regulator NtrX n=1 Tax=Aestuariispira insulae TaxID=1461337 RepID=A0A3D9HUS7_9PROT|nr:sigma-54 dependent transcriptional regulator [Aestuariispira insulae]RED53252.1 two-component system nitrogen regulation response regulator NtrX [Aestuariispira insulae]
MAADILIVDDEADIRMQMAGILEDEGFETREAANSAQAYSAVAARQPSLVILDVWLNASEHDGLQILENIKRDHPSLPIIMISGHGTFDMAVSATKIGAYDFISKPFKTDVLLHTIDRALSEAKLRRENEELQKLTGGGITGLIGDSVQIQDVRKAIEKVAATESRVMITGAPGAGKSLVARLIHKNSTRADGPFVVLNCASLEPETIDAALFGVEATEHDRRKIGVLEEAHGGTLLLDEVADMSLETQGKIVRVLHSQKFQRLGGDTWVDVNVRVLATTNRDLNALIEQGVFREDLYYRLNVVPLAIPPLSARRGDIPALVTYLMDRSATAKGRTARALGDDALAALQGYGWPGNVWELSNVLERLLILAPGDSCDLIGADSVSAALNESEEENLVGWGNAAEVMSLPLREAREAFERDYLLFHLTRFGGNISRTAEFVGMDRAALHRKLKGLGMNGGPKQKAVG